MTKITMVIPTYNDLASLQELLHLIEVSENKHIDYLIVNNGSTDQRIAVTLSKESEFWKSIETEKNLGFGGGILAGITESTTEWIGWMPGNLKILPRDVDALVSNMKLEEKLFIKCHRFRKSIISRTKTFIAGLIQTAISRENLFDTGGTPTICEKSFIMGLKSLPTDYVIESRVLFEARKKKMKILRPTINYGERLHGQSHWQRGLRSEAKLMLAIIRDAKGARSRDKSEHKVATH